MLNKLKVMYNKYFYQNKYKIIYKNKKFLKNGEYKFSDNSKFLYLRDIENLINHILQTTFDMKNSKLISKNKYQGNILRLEKNYGVFNGEMMMFSTSNSEIKFFDFKDKKILTRFRSKKMFKDRTKNMIYFSDYFPLPQIYSINYKNKFYVEELIDKKSEILNYKTRLYNNYLNYFNQCYDDNKYREINLEYFNKKIKDYYLKKQISEIINMKKNCGIPYLRMHGDLWKSNILLSENEYYLIDWEWSNKYSIFYDYFTFILNEATLNNNRDLLKDYFNGDFDGNLAKCTDIFKYKYMPEYKREYFIIFLCEMSVSRWKGEFSKICPDIIDLMKELNIY